MPTLFHLLMDGQTRANLNALPSPSKCGGIKYVRMKVTSEHFDVDLKGGHILTEVGQEASVHGLASIQDNLVLYRVTFLVSNQSLKDNNLHKALTTVCNKLMSC